MADSSFPVTAAPAVADTKLLKACSGEFGYPGASIKAFTVTCPTGTYPVEGLALDLSALFPNKVLGVVLSGLYDPAATTGDLMFPAVYIPASDGDPATGVVHLYTGGAGGTAGLLHATGDAPTVTGYVFNGFAIGY
jgi:hypothetical protein